MILDEIAARTKERVYEAKKCKNLEQLKEEVYKISHIEKEEQFPFEKAMKKEDIAFICEVKKASPSKGIIANDFPYLKIAKDYENAGAAAISVLTEPYYFKGSNEYLREIADNVNIPVLRKDFTVDEYMIYEAKLFGASAVLLICAILNEDEIIKYIKLADELNMSAVVEAHDAQEIETALKCSARIIGVNNRNLKDFTVDINNSVNLRKIVPKDIIFISESGMKTKEDIKILKENGTNGVLIGETLMRSSDKKAMLDELQG